LGYFVKIGVAQQILDTKHWDMIHIEELLIDCHMVAELEIELDQDMVEQIGCHMVAELEIELDQDMVEQIGCHMVAELEIELDQDMVEQIGCHMVAELEDELDQDMVAEFDCHNLTVHQSATAYIAAQDYNRWTV
jgi:hypothetical protein